MYKVKSQPWPKIIHYYHSLVEEHNHNWLRPMLELVEQIQAADWAQNLYGSTSHMQLRISYLPEFNPDKEVLNIDLDHGDGQFRFEHQETASPSYKRWKRTRPPEQALPTLRRFLKMKKWFPVQ